MPKSEVSCKDFVFEILSPRYLSVSEYQPGNRLNTLTEAEVLRPRTFKYRVVDGRIRSANHLTLTGVNTDDNWLFSKEIGSTAYYRHIPIIQCEDLYFKKKYTRYYIPDWALYWELQDISIVSSNASFGVDYLVGSDLTPIIPFGFPSLMEFIKNGCKGLYIIEYLVRVNDKEAWANLKMLETNKPTLVIDQLLTEMIDGGEPTITIRMKFIDRRVIPKNKNASWDQYIEIRDDIKPFKKISDLPITL